MTKSDPKPELVRTGSHSVTLDSFNAGGIREEVFAYFSAAWRGQRVAVTMRADRYTHSSGLSDWRVYAVEARSGSCQERGPELTDLARRRLSDQCRPLVTEWLASDAYWLSEADAYYRAIRRSFDDLRPYSDHPGDRVRELVTVYRAKMPSKAQAQLVLMADAFDTFATLYRAEL